MNLLKKIFNFRKEPIVYAEDSLARLLFEIDEAKKSFLYAQQNLDNAEEPFVDVAAQEVGLAKNRLNALLKRYKKEMQG
jgi:hypothetical protein